MVNRSPAIVFLVVLEHREVGHPQRAPAALEQAGAAPELGVADPAAQGADRIVDDLGAVGAEEDQVAVERAGARDHRIEGVVVEVLDDR